MTRTIEKGLYFGRVPFSLENLYFLWRDSMCLCSKIISMENELLLWIDIKEVCELLVGSTLGLYIHCNWSMKRIWAFPRQTRNHDSLQMYFSASPVFLFVCFVFLHWQVTQTLKNLLYVRNILIIFKQNPKHLCQITYMYDSICPQVFPLLHKTIVRGNIEVQTQRSPSPSVHTIKCSLSFVCGLDWVLLILEYDKSDEMLILWWHYKDIVTYAMLTLFSSHS